MLLLVSAIIALIHGLFVLLWYGSFDITNPIEITGQVRRDGDLLILRADLGGIRRLIAND